MSNWFVGPYISRKLTPETRNVLTISERRVLYFWIAFGGGSEPRFKVRLNFTIKAP